MTIDQVDQAVSMEAMPDQKQAAATLTQDEVNRIVAREKAKAAESARRAAEEKYQQELAALSAQKEQRNASVSREVDADAIYQQVQERWNAEQQALQQRMQEQQLKEQMTQVANNYTSKMSEGKKLYEDFDEVTKEHDPTAFPQLTFLLAGLENAPAVLYDIVKNPMKLAALDRLAERNPRQAQAELLKLSKSIMENQQAQNEAESQVTPEPLDRIAPSRIAGNNGKQSIRDLRSQSWLRG